MGTKILLLDVNEESLRQTAKLLRKNGFIVFSCNTKLRLPKSTSKPDVVLVNDVTNTSRCNESLDLLSQDEGFRNLPVICHFPDSNIYLLKRRLQDGSIAFRPMQNVAVEHAIKMAVSYESENVKNLS